MDLDLQGAGFVVTGGSSGIGLAVARELAGEGAEVLIVGRGRERLDAAVGESGEHGARLQALALDVTGPGAAAALLDGARERLGDLAGLVSAAGSVGLHDLDTAPESEWDGQWELNVEAPRRLMDAFGPALADTGGGAIVNVSSSAGRRPSASYPAYAVSKRGELALTDVYAQHYGPRGVRVNAVAPGPTVTPLWLEPGGLVDQYGAGGVEDREAAVRKRGAGMPLGRLAEPTEIAAAIVFLLAAPHLNGVVWSVDGAHTGEAFS